MRDRGTPLRGVMKRTFAAFLVMCLAGPAARAELKLLPGDVTLTGPHASQRLVAVTSVKGRIEGDVTGAAKFTTANVQVAAVDEDGILHAVGDGETTVTATHGKEQASLKVTVAGTKEPFAWEFRN